MSRADPQRILKTGADLSAGVFKMRCGKGCPATAGQPRKISKKDSGVCPKGGRTGRFRRKIPGVCPKG